MNRKKEAQVGWLAAATESAASGLQLRPSAVVESLARAVGRGGTRLGWIGFVISATLAPSWAYATAYTSTQTTDLQVGDSVTTTGNGAAGMGLSSTAGRVLNAPGDNTISTSGASAHGLYSDTSGGAGAGISASGTTVSVTGANSNAVHAISGSTITLNGVRATSAQGNALFATQISVTADAQTTLTGNGATPAVLAGDSANVVLDGTKVQSTGDGGGGIRIGVFGYLELKGPAVVETTGNGSIGVFSSSAGLRGGNKFPVVGDGVSIITRGQDSHGVLAGTNNRGLTVGAASVVTYGTGADGAQAQFNATLELNGTTITTNGDQAAGMSVGTSSNQSRNSLIAITGNTRITTNGDDASAIRVVGDTNEVHMVNDLVLKTTGARSHGVSLEGGKTEAYGWTNPAGDTLPASIAVAGVDASAFRVTDTGSSLLITSTLPTISLGKDSWTAKAESGGKIRLSEDASVLGGRLWVGGAGSMMSVEAWASAAGSALRVDAGGTFDVSQNDDATGFSLGSLQGDGGRVLLGVSPGQARNLTIDGAEDGIYAGEISGAGSLLRKGSGTLTLTGAQAFGFNGDVEVSSGTLAIAGQAAGAAGGKTFRFANTGSGTLDISQSASGVTVGVLQSVAAGNGVIQLGSNSLTVAGVADSDFSGKIQGSGGLTKQGAANLTLTGAEAFGYSGTTSILDGKITALGNTATASGHAVEIASPGTLDLTGASNFAAGTINGSGTILLGSNSFAVDGAGNSLFSGAIIGAGGLTKLGAGVLKLSGMNALGFGGDATIQDGVLALRGNVDPATFSKRFVLQGGWLDLSESNVPASEGTANNWPKLTIDTTGATSGGVIGSDDNMRYDVGAGKDETVPYHLGDGSTPNGQGIFVVKTGAGTLELANQNYYVGNTRIEGGILRVRSDGNLGGQINGKSREVVLNGGDLQVAGSFTSARDIEMRQNGAVIVDAGVATSWNSIQGARMVLAKRGDGSIMFSKGGALGGAIVEAGTLALNNATVGAFGASAPVQMRGGTFSLSQGSIISSNDAIVATGDSTVTLSDNVAIQAPGAAYRATGNAQATLNLNVMRNVDFQIAADGVGTALQINLDQVGRYSGVPMATGGAKIGLALKDAGSEWAVPANAILHSLDNQGSIEFAAPAGGAYKSVEVKGNYAGGGGITLHTALNAGGALSAQQTDRLLVQGNATGRTILTLNGSDSGANTNTAGNNGYMPNEGISLVQVGGAASADAFNLVNDFIASKGGLQYRLFAYGAGSLPAPDQSQSLLGDTPLTVDFRLQTAYIKDGKVVPGVPPNNNGRPALVPQGSSYLSAGMAMQNYSGFVLDNLRRRLGDVRQSDNTVGEAAAVESYARFIGGRDKYRSDRSFNDYGYDFDQDNQALQFGGNWLASDDAQQRLRLGGAITLGSSKVKPNAQDIEKSKFSMDGRSVALTATWTHHSGWYADGILSFGRYSGPVSTDKRGNVGKLRGDSYDVSAEVGRTMVFASGLLIEPQFQLRSQTLRIQDLTDDDGVKVKFGKQQIWSGRVGVLASYPLAGPQSLTPYARIDLLHGAGDAGKVSLSGADYTPGRVGSAVQLSIGANGMVARNTSLYGEISGQRRLGGYGFSGGDINFGVRHRF